MSSPADASTVLDAFGDPTRREILLVLAEGEMSVSDIANRIEHVGRTAVSSHLRVLRLAGVVNERRHGRFRYYSIDPTPATQVVDFVASIYRSALSDLEVAAQKTRERPAGRRGSSKTA
ncbi:MAG TPA: metalloregulator ArsR/SmtB family transcription factor [Nocardioides sp.]|uniref:ArsR/SmtB family transcription factor n=1 Tax=uncultured Nocardioides sp. TaxID=198441 RepID=UPI00263576FA|nr:metalloregulator ArsR/SmtB family transcription factor [uncultured Nocardioides sp.]HRI94130.1 metalloregulator ArsR/SmtB family transcription factor [Nocardioides sp.]